MTKPPITKMRTEAEELARITFRLQHYVGTPLQKKVAHSLYILDKEKRDPAFKTMRRKVIESGEAIDLAAENLAQFDWLLCPCHISSLTTKQEALIHQINEDIAERTHLGLREEQFDEHTIQLSWGNSIGRWIVHKPHRTTLDANELFVHNTTAEEINHIVCCLNDLPLFRTSFEGWSLISETDPELAKELHMKALALIKEVDPENTLLEQAFELEIDKLRTEREGEP